MKVFIAPLLALVLSTPAFAQEWPKQDWYVLTVPLLSSQAPASTMRDGGANPPYEKIIGPQARPDGRPPARQNLALDINSINRTGDALEVTYFVWSDQRSNYTRTTSRIDCSRTGEWVLLSQSYDRDFTPIETNDQTFRRTDATARAVANHACLLPRGHRVSGKSLPEVVRDRS